MTFQFLQAAELLHTTQYLLQFDDTVRFRLVREGRRTVLQVSTVNVPPFSYTTVDFVNESEQPCKLVAFEPLSVSWAVNAAFLASVVGCFEGPSSVTLEVTDDLACVLLYQKRGNDQRVQVAQIGALHDLGPKLLVDHDVQALYTIADVRNFSELVHSACAGDDDRCDVSLRRVSATTCELVLRTSTICSSLQLSLSESGGVAKHMEGTACCADLHEYARLCTRMTKAAPKTALMVGFGTGGIALFRFEWFAECGTRTADLFFCTS